jgi:hypothetical protein
MGEYSGRFEASRIYSGFPFFVKDNVQIQKRATPSSAQWRLAQNWTSHKTACPIFATTSSSRRWALTQSANRRFCT